MTRGIVERASGESQLHPNLRTIDAFARIRTVFQQQFNLHPEDGSLVLEGCIEKEGAKIHTLVMRWGERAETDSSGRRYYIANGIALVTAGGTGEVDLFRTDQIDRTWLSYDARSKTEPFLMNNYPGWTWEERLQNAYGHASPIAADLYRYASSLKNIPNQYRGLGTVCSGGYSRMLMWVAKTGI